MKVILVFLIILLLLIEFLIIRKGLRSAKRQRTYYNLLRNQPGDFERTISSDKEDWIPSFNFTDQKKSSRRNSTLQEEIQETQQTQVIDELGELEEVSEEEVMDLEGSAAESQGDIELESELEPSIVSQEDQEPAQEGHASTPEEHLKMGIELLRENNLEAGIQEIQTAIRLQPNLADAHFNLGLAYSLQNNPEAAMEAYQQAIRLDPKYGKAYFNLGTLFLKKGELLAPDSPDLPDVLAKAVECLEYAVRYLPDSTKALWNLYEAYRLNAQFDKALAILLKLKEIESEDASLMNHLGICYAKLGDYDHAIESWEKALALKAPSQLIYYNLGKAYETKGVVEKAMSNYRRFIALASTSPERRYLVSEAKQRLESLRGSAQG
ncbi:MAG TPA: tetratricopeptide repeat protein [Candidatus Limnocylindrales bacterium]|nr:tetratricopeptide repeat protein [Candidatus Limnocylindrales bacterium]